MYTTARRKQRTCHALADAPRLALRKPAERTWFELLKPVQLNVLRETDFNMVMRLIIVTASGSRALMLWASLYHQCSPCGRSSNSNNYVPLANYLRPTMEAGYFTNYLHVRSLIALVSNVWCHIIDSTYFWSHFYLLIEPHAPSIYHERVLGLCV